MSVKKVKEVDSIYSGSSTKRNRIFDDISCSSNATERWTSILSCCWRRKPERKFSLKEYNPNECDYIVEKLVVKRVPLSLYATAEDYQEFIDEKNQKETSQRPPMGPNVIPKEMRDKQIYSVWPEIDSSFYFLKHKAREDFSNRPSNKNLRFDRDEDMLDEDAVQAGPSNYKRHVSSRVRGNEMENAFLDQFSALHPDLKESERPPKDPNPLNPPRSKRSLAESISEIGSAKKGPSAKFKKGRDKNKRGSNVYITVSDNSKEMSTVLGDEEIPTRDKYVAKHTTAATCREMCSTSCTSCPQKCSESRNDELEEGGKNNRPIKSPHNRHKSLGKFVDRDSSTKPIFKGPQLIARNVSPEYYSANKLPELNRTEIDSGFINQRTKFPDLSKPDNDKSNTDVTSFISNELKNKNSSATTLRWKIIIKHHQPTTSQTASESTTEIHEDSRVPAIQNDGFNTHKEVTANTESLDEIEISDEINDKNKNEFACTI